MKHKTQFIQYARGYKVYSVFHMDGDHPIMKRQGTIEYSSQCNEYLWKYGISLGLYWYDAHMLKDIYTFIEQLNKTVQGTQHGR